MRYQGLFLRYSFNTQPPEGGWAEYMYTLSRKLVSTHSRLKAAGTRFVFIQALSFCFNTQPPEGGWHC